MDGWMQGGTDVYMDGGKDERMEGQTGNGWKDTEGNGWMEGWTGGWVKGWREEAHELIQHRTNLGTTKRDRHRGTMVKLWGESGRGRWRGQGGRRRDRQGAVRDGQAPTPGQSSHQPHGTSQDPHLQPWALAPHPPAGHHRAAPTPPSPALLLPSTQAGLARAVPAAWPRRQAHRAVCRAIVRRGWLRSRSSAVISHVPISSSCPARGWVRGGTHSAEPTGEAGMTPPSPGRGSPMPCTTMCCFTRGWKTLLPFQPGQEGLQFNGKPQKSGGKTPNEPDLGEIFQQNQSFLGSIFLGYVQQAAQCKGDAVRHLRVG